MTEPNIDDAIRILQESSRRTVEYINELQAENERLRRALQDRHEKPCNKSCAPGYCYCECPHGVTDGNCKECFAALVAAVERERIIAENAPVIEKINAHIKALEDELAAIRARSYT